MSADGTDAAAPAPAAAPAGGATILTSNLPPPTAAPPPNSAEATVQQAMDGPPEWAPAKFWDPEKKTIRAEDLGRGYKNLEQLLGREKVPVPVADDDQEGWDRWYKATGRPDKPDDYEFERPDKLPNDLPYDEDMEKEYRQWAHMNGLNKKQAKNFYDGFVKRQIERHAAWSTHQQQKKAEVQADMMREYGNQYEGNVQLARSALAQYADADYLKYLDETGLGNDPRTIRAWIKIGKEMSGVQKLKGSMPAQSTPNDISKAIIDFNAKHEKALFQKDHPQHDWAVKERAKLFEALHAQ